MSREVQGETVLLQLDTGEYFGLDAVATRIWQLIAEKGDLQDVCTALTNEYDVDADTAARDIDRLVSELVERKLIEIDQSA